MSAHAYHDTLHLLVKALVDIVVSEHVVELFFFFFLTQCKDMQLGELYWNRVMSF